MGPIIMDALVPFSSFEVDASDGKISRPDYLTIERRAIPRLQVSKVAWRSDAERLAVSDSFGGIWVLAQMDQSAALHQRISTSLGTVVFFVPFCATSTQATGSENESVVRAC